MIHYKGQQCSDTLTHLLLGRRLILGQTVDRVPKLGNLIVAITVRASLCRASRCIGLPPPSAKAMSKDKVTHLWVQEENDTLLSSIAQSAHINGVPLVVLNGDLGQLVSLLQWAFAVGGGFRIGRSFSLLLLLGLLLLDRVFLLLGSRLVVGLGCRSLLGRYLGSGLGSWCFV